MSEPIFNSDEWPKTATGHVDWEQLFEVPKTGFVPYIKSAGVPPRLRVNALQIIRALFTRKDDGSEVGRLSTELTELIPDEMPEERFPVVGSAVVRAMREIKSYRINKAIEYDRQKEAEDKGSERRGAKTER